jgi:predicted dehydrogenase
MLRPLRLGLLGTGIAARKLYWPALRGLQKQVQLWACANRTRAKAEAFARDTGTPVVLDTAEALFARPELDAVLISLPIDQQPRYVLKALEAGKHVLSEKPVAPNLAAGRRLLKAAQPWLKRGCIWMVGENYRFMPHVRTAETWLADGALGDVRLVEVRQVSLLTPENPYYHTAWRRNPAFVGGFVVDAGIHLAALLRHFLGAPTAIHSLRASFNPSLKPYDTTVAVLRFRHGAVGTWTSAFSTQGKGPRLILRGSRADLTLHGDHAVLEPHHGRPRRTPKRGLGFREQFLHFAACVRERRAPCYGPAEALTDLAVMQGVVEGTVLKP